MAKVICKAVDYSFIIQDDKIVILNIPPSRKALPEDLHIRARNKEMVHGLLLITEMTFIMLCYFVSEKSDIGRQDAVRCRREDGIHSPNTNKSATSNSESCWQLKVLGLNNTVKPKYPETVS